MKRIAGLDVLRGIAILLVMLRHAFPEVFPGAGVVGVVVFFTLSGYLITGVLTRELESKGRVDFKRFYLRRARRLLPALIALTVVFVVVTLVFDPLGERDKLIKTAVVLLTFTGNLPIGGISPAAFHSWTLATEEQFYLLWPALLAFAWARRKISAALVVTALAALAACTATLVWLWPHADNAYALPTSWFVCFVIGAATRLKGTAVPRWAVPVALVGLAVLSVIPLRGHALTYLVAGPTVAGCTAVLLLAWSKWEQVATPIRPLVALGVLSYGAYLWNYPLTLWLRPDLGAAAGPVAAVLTIVAAALSWRYVEEPVIELKDGVHMKRLRRLLATGLAVGLTAVLAPLASPSPAMAAMTDCQWGRLCLWEHIDYYGIRTEYTSNFAVLVFQDTASSAWNNSADTWCLYEDTYYGGKFTRVGPGQASPDMREQRGNDIVSSVRKC